MMSNSMKIGDPVVDSYLDDILMFYNTGKRHGSVGRAMYERAEFLHRHPELETEEIVACFSSVEIHEVFVNGLYFAYCRGYNGEEL